eukprot:1574890-Alexandrium_andersonii.AAC.1
MTPATPVRRSRAQSPELRAGSGLPLVDPELPGGTAKLPIADSVPPELRVRSSRSPTCSTAPVA